MPAEADASAVDGLSRLKASSVLPTTILRTLSGGQWTLAPSEVTKLASPSGGAMDVIEAILLAPRSFDPATIVSWHAYAVAADPQLGGGVVDETSEVEWLVNH